MNCISESIHFINTEDPTEKVYYEVDIRPMKLNEETTWIMEVSVFNAHGVAMAKTTVFSPKPFQLANRKETEREYYKSILEALPSGEQSDCQSGNTEF